MHVYKKIGFHGHTDNIAHDRDRVKRNSPSYAWQTLTDYFFDRIPEIARRYGTHERDSDDPTSLAGAGHPPEYSTRSTANPLVIITTLRKRLLDFSNLSIRSSSVTQTTSPSFAYA